jgi:hypothetical protein
LGDYGFLFPVPGRQWQTEALAQIDGGVVKGQALAWAHNSRALPERPHLKQWKVCWSRLAEKQRLVPDVEPVVGKGRAAGCRGCCWP